MKTNEINFDGFDRGTVQSKMPPVKQRSDIRNRPRIPIPDEDPYSVAGSGSSGSSDSHGNGGAANGANGVGGNGGGSSSSGASGGGGGGGGAASKAMASAAGKLDAAGAAVGHGAVNGNGVASAAGANGKEHRRADKPPKLPPRDNGIYGSNIPKVSHRSLIPFFFFFTGFYRVLLGLTGFYRV